MIDPQTPLLHSYEYIFFDYSLISEKQKISNKNKNIFLFSKYNYVFLANGASIFVVEFAIITDRTTLSLRVVLTNSP